MNQFQSKQTMKKKIGGGFFGRIARSFHARKESKCKRKADDIINKCIIHNNENNNANNNANPYTNISLCIHSDNNFYYVNHNKRRYIYHKSLMSKDFWKRSHTFFETAHSEFSYIFITAKEDIDDKVNNNSKEYRYPIKMVEPKSFGYFANLLCIPCDMFGLIPNDAYSTNINTHTKNIKNWPEFISKEEVQLNIEQSDKKYLINYLS